MIEEFKVKKTFLGSNTKIFKTIEAQTIKEIQQSETSNLISIESLEMSIYNSGQKFKI
jgi:hypothetical protein